jgi:hypothetical protein
MRQRAAKYCRWEIMFIVWTAYASLPAAPPDPLIPLSFTSNGAQTHRFAPTTVLSTRDWSNGHVNGREVLCERCDIILSKLWIDHTSVALFLDCSSTNSLELYRFLHWSTILLSWFYFRFPYFVFLFRFSSLLCSFESIWKHCFIVPSVRLQRSPNSLTYFVQTRYTKVCRSF